MSKMVYLKTDVEIAVIKANGDLLGRTHAEVAKIIKAGVTTKELDTIADTFIKDNGGHPSFKGYQVGKLKFPAALCISINDVVVHGIPNSYQPKDGDIVSIDCGFYKNGFHADSAYTYGIGNVKPEVQALMRTTKESLFEGISKAGIGIRRTACVMATAPITTANNATISMTNNKPPDKPLDCDSPNKAAGKRATIPIIINIEIPFPIPLSVIFSPNHIQNIVPATKIITEYKRNETGSIFGNKAPCEIMVTCTYVKACAAVTKIVKTRVI